MISEIPRFVDNVNQINLQNKGHNETIIYTKCFHGNPQI